MADLKKVFRGLECCQDCDGYTCRNCCPYHDRNEPEDQPTCTCRLAHDALSLLKEQEPILLENQHKPYGISTNANSPWISRCPRCGKKVEGKQTRFCKYCGQAVKWG